MPQRGISPAQPVGSADCDRSSDLRLRCCAGLNFRNIMFALRANMILPKSCGSRHEPPRVAREPRASMRCGAGGIRTLGTSYLVQQFSKLPLSTTQPPLQNVAKASWFPHLRFAAEMRGASQPPLHYIARRLRGAHTSASLRRCEAHHSHRSINYWRSCTSIIPIPRARRGIGIFAEEVGFEPTRPVKA